MNINYLTGDATRPSEEQNGIIVHVCNDAGKWGKGFVLALSQRWKQPEQCFRNWAQASGNPPYHLGQVQFVQVEPTLWVANLVGQHGIRSVHGVPPVRYDAIQLGLQRVAIEAQRLNAVVHMPRIACGLAGGTWRQIEPIIQTELVNKNIIVFVYDYPTQETDAQE